MTIEQLSIIEQNLSSLVLSRQTLQKQLLEVEHAAKELVDASDAYEIIGTIMIKKDAETLREELNSRKETISVKLESVKKQEESLRKQLEDAQKNLMEE